MGAFGQAYFTLRWFPVPDKAKLNPTTADLDFAFPIGSGVSSCFCSRHVSRYFFSRPGVGGAQLLPTLHRVEDSACHPSSFLCVFRRNRPMGGQEFQFVTHTRSAS